MATDDEKHGDASASTIQTTEKDHVLLVTLDRPARGNALDARMMSELSALWARVADDRDLRCVIVTGAGSSFCTGADVSMLADERRGADTADQELAFLPGRRIGIPVIAAVNGTCAGGGLHFVADADFAIAAEGARFVDPHVTVGQVSALEPIQLRLRMRADILARMVLLGRHEMLDAAAAERAGLVSQVLPLDALLPTAWELAGRIASNSPEAVRLSRQALRATEERLIADDLELGWDAIRGHWDHPDASEGPAAYLEKREPKWDDR
jgi:enoyl-CoA hydratase/carnithine racemase